jgi:hypothetical protein
MADLAIRTAQQPVPKTRTVNADNVRAPEESPDVVPIAFKPLPRRSPPAGSEHLTSTSSDGEQITSDVNQNGSPEFNLRIQFWISKAERGAIDRLQN